jgi:hypothetical protein
MIAARPSASITQNGPTIQASVVLSAIHTTASRTNARCTSTIAKGIKQSGSRALYFESWPSAVATCAPADPKESSISYPTFCCSQSSQWSPAAKRLHVPDNITLLPLPPYSPELNPMENIWDYLRGQPAQQACLGQLRGHRRRLQGRLALPHRRSRPHQFHLSSLLGGPTPPGMWAIGAPIGNTTAWLWKAISASSVGMLNTAWN